MGAHLIARVLEPSCMLAYVCCNDTHVYYIVIIKQLQQQPLLWLHSMYTMLKSRRVYIFCNGEGESYRSTQRNYSPIRNRLAHCRDRWRTCNSCAEWCSADCSVATTKACSLTPGLLPMKAREKLVHNKVRAFSLSWCDLQTLKQRINFICANDLEWLLKVIGTYEIYSLFHTVNF